MPLKLINNHYLSVFIYLVYFSACFCREDVMAEIYLKMMDMKSIETLQLDDNANWPDSIFSFCYIHHPILKDCL